MTLRLILTRHAKSDWGNPALDDKDRSLNARGKADAPKIGAWIRSMGYEPQEVLCSSATRTQETLRGLGYDHAPAIKVLDALYLAEPEDILALLGTVQAANVQIIAHNPGIGALANALLEDEPDHPDFYRYPTGATAIIDFGQTDWIGITAGTLVDFRVPRDL